MTAAAGGVGGLLVQLVRRAGAEVVALAGGEAKTAHARELGASIAVDYRVAGWPRRLDATLHGRGVDVVFDGVGGDVSAPLAARLRRGGRYVPHGAASGRWGTVGADDLAGRGVEIVPLSSVAATREETFALVDDALHLAASGALRLTIGQVRALEEAAAAHAAMEARSTIGKTLLVTDEFGRRRSSTRSEDMETSP